MIILFVTVIAGLSLLFVVVVVVVITAVVVVMLTVRIDDAIQCK